MGFNLIAEWLKWSQKWTNTGSNGQRVCLLNLRSKFESWWSLHFLFCQIVWNKRWQKKETEDKMFWPKIIRPTKHRIFPQKSFPGSLGLLGNLYIPILGDLSYLSMPDWFLIHLKLVGQSKFKPWLWHGDLLLHSKD